MKKVWSERKIRATARFVIIMINLVLCFITRNHYVSGIILGSNLVIIIENIVELSVQHHNNNLILKPLKNLHKNLVKFRKELEKEMEK